MKQAPSDQIGERGQIAVELFFNDLGWGPLSTGKHDLGTDLFVQLRHDDLTDLGMLLGVQVKTGNSYFAKPALRGGERGWWYRESDRKHELYWTNHHIPHILVMQDEARTQQVWARLDRKSIELTGKGFRVFVPEDQALSANCAATWTEIVAEARKLQSFEGARWNFDITQLPEHEWPRYALLASRIVAPHPNQGFNLDINWAEAVALCIQGDVQRWDHFASERSDVPNPTEARDLEDPGWNFAAATYDWLKGSTDKLEALNSVNMPAPLRIAHSICLSTVLEDRGDWDGARKLLESLRQSDDHSVDQAWLAMHLGWIHLECGRLDEAQRAFSDSVAMHAAFPSSLTNSAIRDAGILALFEIAPRFSGDISAAVKASDSTLSWWQTQQIEDALNSVLRRSFSAWARDPSVTFVSQDVTHNNLISTALASRLLGNQRSRRYSSYLRAMASLALPSGPYIKPEEQLETLRLAGYPKELSLALRRIRREGPLEVVRTYMHGISVERSTTTSLRADLESLEVAGSYLPTDSADQWIAFLLDAFANPKALGDRYNLIFDFRHELLDALVGLQLHLSRDNEERVIHLALELPDESTRLLENPLRRLLRSLSHETLTSQSESIYERGRTLAEGSWLGHLLVELASSVTPEARSMVTDRILSGSLGAIPDGFSIDSLTADEACAVVAACEREIGGYRGQLNGIGLGGPDPYRLLAMISLWGPEGVREQGWNTLVEGLSETDSLHDRKTGTLDLLASHGSAIPQTHRRALLSLTKQFRDVEPSQFALLSGPSLQPAGPAFKELFLELSDEDGNWHEVLGGLLAGSPSERCRAIDVLARRDGHELLLLALSRDSDFEVSHSAMRGLARRAAEETSVAQAVLGHLQSLVLSSGERAAIEIGSGILEASKRVSHIAPLVVALQRHESLVIRSQADKLAYPEQATDSN